MLLQFGHIKLRKIQPDILKAIIILVGAVYIPGLKDASWPRPCPHVLDGLVGITHTCCNRLSDLVR